MALTEFQHQCITDTREWFEAVYRPWMDMLLKAYDTWALWAVFNALYNVADYPKVSLRGVSSDGGKTIPIIHGRMKIKNFALLQRDWLQIMRLLPRLSRPR